MIRHELHLPKKYNNGRAVPSKVMTEALQKVLELFGGFTAFDAIGQWKNEEGKVFVDEQVVVLADSESKHNEFDELVEYLRKVFKQEELYAVTLEVA